MRRDGAAGVAGVGMALPRDGVFAVTQARDAARCQVPRATRPLPQACNWLHGPGRSRLRPRSHRRGVGSESQARPFELRTRSGEDAGAHSGSGCKAPRQRTPGPGVPPARSLARPPCRARHTRARACRRTVIPRLWTPGRTPPDPCLSRNLVANNGLILVSRIGAALAMRVVEIWIGSHRCRGGSVARARPP